MFPPGSPFEQFFKDFLNRNRPGGQRRARRQSPAPERRMQSLGSGFIIDPSGLVVTNNHVIDGADEITVTLQDNTSLKAKVIGRDETGDIALLQVKPDKPLPAVQFGDCDAERVGDWVLAIGNPFGLGGTVTAGIVSARGRDIHQGPYDDFIQTDAAINRGNSGGPLFNMDGQVIGINTAIYSPSGGSIGIGFSIPSNMAKNVVDQLKDFGHPRRGWLGVRIQQVTPDIAESLGLKDAERRHGRRRERRRPGRQGEDPQRRHHPEIQRPGREGDAQPAAHRGRFRGRQAGAGRAVARRQGGDGAGDAGREAGRRAGRRGDTGRQAGAAKPTEISGLGLKLAPITPGDEGQVPARRRPEGRGDHRRGAEQPAAERGLKAGDVIVEVQQGEVASPADVQEQVDSVRKENRKSVLMLIQRQDGLQWVPLSLSGDKDKQPG